MSFAISGVLSLKGKEAVKNHRISERVSGHVSILCRHAAEGLGAIGIISVSVSPLPCLPGSERKKKARLRLLIVVIAAEAADYLSCRDDDDDDDDDDNDDCFDGDGCGGGPVGRVDVPEPIAKREAWSLAEPSVN